MNTKISRCIFQTSKLVSKKVIEILSVVMTTSQINPSYECRKWMWMESESGQMVLKIVKWTYFDAYLLTGAGKH